VKYRFMKLRFSMLLAATLLTLAPMQTWGQSSLESLNQQLQQSVSRQQWSQAIGIIDQMIKLSPAQAVSLKQYRARLQQLQQSSGPAPSPPTAAKVGIVGQVPIKRRSSGVPIVDVTFNGRQSFEMLVDSGASFTVITRPMARALGITPAHFVDRVTVSTANGTAQFPIVYLNSIEVGGLSSNRIRVAIAGPDMDMGLLGQDFLQKYDVILRSRQIEFSQRQ
jgi:aspartyl protease family protein